MLGLLGLLDPLQPCRHRPLIPLCVTAGNNFAFSPVSLEETASATERQRLNTAANSSGRGSGGMGSAPAAPSANLFARQGQLWHCCHLHVRATLFCSLTSEPADLQSRRQSHCS